MSERIWKLPQRIHNDYKGTQNNHKETQNYYTETKMTTTIQNNREKRNKMTTKTSESSFYVGEMLGPLACLFIS